MALHGKFDVVVVGKGTHGPFKDEQHPEDRSKDRYYPYVSINAADGEGEPVKSTLAPGLTWDPELYKPVTVELEIRPGGKLRCHGPAKPAAQVRAA